MQAHTRFPVLESRIRHHHFGNVLPILCLALCCSWAWAQSSPIPYTARVIGETVLVRSGPGTDQYQCGSVGLHDTVQVLGEQNGWARIVPPPGSYSWISTQYVNLTLRDATVGIVMGNGVRVYAGSDIVAPMHSTAKQAELKREDKVKLMGEERDGYFKIVPPKEAVLYVSSRYLKRIDPAGTPVVTPPVTTGSMPIATMPDPNHPVVPDVNATAEDESTTEFLKAFYALQEQVLAEVKKPLAEQDYSAIKKALQELPETEDAEKADRFAKFLLNRIEAYELVQQVNQDLQVQDDELKKATGRIDKARLDKLRSIGQQGLHTVIGTLKESAIFSGARIKRYRILDPKGKTLCYAEPVGSLATQDFSNLIGKKVGLVGTIKAQPAIGSALIEFSKIEAVEPPPVIES